MLVDDAFSEKGVFVPEQLGDDARLYCFQNLAELGVSVDEMLQQRTVYKPLSRAEDVRKPPVTAASAEKPMAAASVA